MIPGVRPIGSSRAVAASVAALRRPAARIAALGALAAIGASLAGCGGDGPTVPPPTTGTVALQFDHRVGASDLVLETDTYTNAAGNAYRVSELRYFVSNLEFVRGDGTTHVVGGVHLRDAEVANSRAWQATGIPAGHYTAVRFRFGLDTARNVPNGLPATVENLRMVWPELLGGGYHYMLLDGFYTDSANPPTWMAHLGRLVSMTQPTPVDPSFVVELPAVIHVAGGSHADVQVVVDVNQWFAASEIYDFEVYGAFMMDNPVALTALHDNGAAGVFSLGAVTVVPQ